MKKALFHLIFAAALVVIFLISAEAGLRLFSGKYSRVLAYTDERNSLYRYDADIGWAPIPFSAQYFTGSRKVFVKHNNSGFRDRAHGQKTKKRIMFLGDSFVWGYDADQDKVFTVRLQESLPDMEVLNMGLSGYGTDQEYLLLKRDFDKYQPDIVAVIFSDTDIYDNSTNMRYFWYFKPYFIYENGLLKLNGQPVPKSLNFYFSKHKWLYKSYLFKAVLQLVCGMDARMKEFPDITDRIMLSMKKFAESKGARFMVGFACDNSQLEAFCKNNGIAYLSLKGAGRYPSYGRHWDEGGHKYVADKIYDFLIKNRYVAGQ